VTDAILLTIAHKTESRVEVDAYWPLTLSCVHRMSAKASMALFKSGLRLKKS